MLLRPKLLKALKTHLKMHFFRDCRRAPYFWQLRAGVPAQSILMYYPYTAVLRAVLPYTDEKITIFRGTLKLVLEGAGCQTIFWR
jgi:hypothetical protein